MLMRGRGTLLILGIVFAALVLLTLAQQGAPALTGPTPRPLGRVYPDLAVLDMAAIRLRAPDAGAPVLLLTRAESGAWLGPDGAPFDADTAASIARTIALLPYQRTLPPPESGDLVPYGFAPRGLFVIEVVTLDGTGYAVEVGELARSEAAYYALVDERPDLYLLDRAAIAFLIQQYRAFVLPPTPVP